jgi:cytochrome c peroxidase
MRSNTPKFVGTIAIATGIAALAGGVATRLSAETVVGQTRMVDFSQLGKPAEPVRLEKLRASYRRPNFIPFPKENPYTAQKVELGQELYFDARLSGARLLSCASCRNPAYAWVGGLPKGIGHLMKELGRRSATIVNAA